MSSQQQRDPFAPFLSKLPTEEAYVNPIKETIEHIRTFLRRTRGWEEVIINEIAPMLRMIDESLGYDDSQQPSTTIATFFSTQKGQGLLDQLNERIKRLVPETFLKLPTPPRSPSRSEPKIEEVTKHEKELQERGKEENERDPGAFILKLSYDDLEHQLKQCLLYFSAFPENQVIKKRTIIYWWIGEGLVRPSKDGRTAEQVGEDCFKMILASGLIEPIYGKLSTTANYCKIYPWVQKMLEAEFLIFQNRLTDNHDTCKRVCLAVENKEDWAAVSSVGVANERLSLFNYNVHYLSCGQKTLEEFKAINTLQRGRWQNLSTHHIEVADESFLNDLQSLTELKYLSLHGISRITNLPDSIKKLANLLILDLRSCHNLEHVNPAVTSLSSLTHLDVSGCYLLEKMPQGIGSMSNLQVLKGFVVGGEGSCELRELSKLQKLWKLSISIGSEARVSSELTELVGIKTLRSLRITWGQAKQSPKETMRKKPSVLDNGRQHASKFSDLEKLALECVPNNESVSWLKPDRFTKLKRLYIEGGKVSKLSLVTRDDKRWNVEILRLKFLEKLKLNWADIGKQKQASEQEMKWTDVKNELPQLRGAQIYHCTNIGIVLDGFDEKGIWVNSNK